MLSQLEMSMQFSCRDAMELQADFSESGDEVLVENFILSEVSFKTPLI